MANPKLSFYLICIPIGTLRIDASNDGGSTFSNVFTKSGDQGDQWNFEIVSLAIFTDTIAQNWRLFQMMETDKHGQRYFN